MEEGRYHTWDHELVLRQEALKCRACGGTNPYVCRCAKEAFIKRQEARKRERPTLSKEEQLEQEWQSFKMLNCCPDLVVCGKCNTGECKSFCPCAKKKWIEWKNKV
jgi:hypothetical protein